MGIIYSQLFFTPPRPLHSFAGQTVIVTGSNTGLGLEAARHIAANGASKVILAVRNLKAGEIAKLSIEKTTKCDSSVIEVWHLDLGSYDSVKSFGARVNRDLPRLDICLMNAGKGTYQFSLLEGHESTITVNVISTFLLALLVLPKMRDTRQKNTDMAQPTLTIVSSTAHILTTFPLRNSEGGIFNALDTETDMSQRYETSKFLDIIATKALAEQISKDDDGNPMVIVNTVCPGLCRSELGREAGWGFWALTQVMGRRTEIGSRTLVHAAAAGNMEFEKVGKVDGGMEVHGKFLSDCRIAECRLSDVITGKDKVEGLKGEELQHRVWAELSAIMEAVVPGVTKNA